MPFSALLVASAVALEKDRKTLDLLLLTNLSNSELVLGKLLAGMLSVVVVVVAALPLLMIIALLGGVSTEPDPSRPGRDARQRPGRRQPGLDDRPVAREDLSSAGDDGAGDRVVARWLGNRRRRRRCNESGSECLPEHVGRHDESLAGDSGSGAATRLRAARRLAPVADPVDAVPVGSSLGIAVLLNFVAIALVRVWNPPREVGVSKHGRGADDADDRVASARCALAVSVHSAGGKVRPVWDNPILWREIRTWAYGKKILIIRLAYWAVFLACAAVLISEHSRSGRLAPIGMRIPPAAKPLITLLVVGLILLNALAVTSLTNERDSRCTRPAAGHRFVAQGDRVRQAGRRVLQRQGDDSAADRACASICGSSGSCRRRILCFLARRAWP